MLPVTGIILAVILANLLYMTKVFNPNPINQQAGLTKQITPGPLPGLNTIDPNTGSTAQALGHRSAADWAHGTVPWWTPYEGVGSPLAAEMNSAAFLPITGLLGFTNGQIYFYAILEAIGGVSTYFLLRRLAIGTTVSTVAGMLFALNGTFAWFRFSATNPVAFLPLMLLGVELCYSAAKSRRPFGWAVLAVSIALSVYAGFPETTAINGGFAVFWFGARTYQLPANRLLMTAKVLAGVGVGLLLSAPLVVAFLDYLPHAFVGPHGTGVFAHLSLPHASVPALLLPYVYGPIFGFAAHDRSGTLTGFWGSVGGYLAPSLVAFALVGLANKRDRALRIVLAAWVILALARVYGFPGVDTVFSWIPGESKMAFYRYASPSISMGVIVLAAFGIDDLLRNRVNRRWMGVCALTTLIAVALSALGAIPEIRRLTGAPHNRLWALSSIGWALALLTLIAAVALFAKGRPRLVLLLGLLVVESLAFFVVPELSAPRSAQIDTQPVAFLRSNLGTSRFFSLGPIQPDYGSYFALSSVNANDSLLPKAWAGYITRSLESNTNPLTFTGVNPLNPSGTSPVAEMISHLAAYEQVGTKFVIAPSGFTFPSANQLGVRQVFRDDIVSIFELPNPMPYFKVDNNACSLRYSNQDQVSAICSRSATLHRAELYMPGWEASDGANILTVNLDGPLFQAVRLPAGTSTVTFHFVPPHTNLAFAGFIVGVLILIVYAVVTVRRQRLQQELRSPVYSRLLRRTP